jgi:CRISPR-associated exonuclease Cas4
MAELITAGELKNWAYCRRVVFYRRHMREASRETFKMREGIAAQELVERLEMRRTMLEYGLAGWQRRFGLWLTAPRAGLSGKLDLILQADGEAAPVDFKLTTGPVGDNHRMQLAAYAVLIEESLGVMVRRAFLYRIPDDRVFVVEIGAEERDAVAAAVEAIRRMDELEMMPEATDTVARCRECEYANYCGDVW